MPEMHRVLCCGRAHCFLQKRQDQMVLSLTKDSEVTDANGTDHLDHCHTILPSTVDIDVFWRRTAVKS